MKSDKYIIDAVILRGKSTVDGIDVISVSVLGYGMRGILPMLLRIVEEQGSYAISVSFSEIELTVTVPAPDASAVMRAFAEHISREPKALLARNREWNPQASTQIPLPPDKVVQMI